MGLINIIDKGSISFNDLVESVKKEFIYLCCDFVKEVKYDSKGCLIFGNKADNILFISNIDSEDVYIVAWVSIDKMVSRDIFSDGNRVNLLRVFSSAYPKSSPNCYMKANLKHLGDIELNEKTVRSIATWTVDTADGKFYKRKANTLSIENIYDLYCKDMLDFNDDISDFYLSTMAPNKHRLNTVYNIGNEYCVHNRRITIFDRYGKGLQTSINAARLVYCATTSKTLDDIKDYEVDHIQGSLDDSASNLQLVTGNVNKLLQHYRRMFCNA